VENSLRTDRARSGREMERQVDSDGGRERGGIYNWDEGGPNRHLHAS